MSEIENPNILNPNILNPNILNPNILNDALASVIRDTELDPLPIVLEMWKQNQDLKLQLQAKDAYWNQRIGDKYFSTLQTVILVIIAAVVGGIITLAIWGV